MEKQGLQDPICECATCGYKWERGTSGAHFCATVMKDTIAYLKAQNEALKDIVAVNERKSNLPDFRVINMEFDPARTVVNIALNLFIKNSIQPTEEVASIQLVSECRYQIILKS